MNIDKERLINDLKSHKEKIWWNCNKYQTEYETGYLQGIDFAIRVVNFQPEASMGQVKFDFDCAWMEVK